MTQAEWLTIQVLFRGITTQPPSEMIGWLHVTSRRRSSRPMHWHERLAASLAMSPELSARHSKRWMSDRSKSFRPPPGIVVIASATEPDRFARRGHRS